MEALLVLKQVTCLKAELEVFKHLVSARCCARHLRVLEYTYLRTMGRPKTNYYHSLFLINKEL